MIYRINYNTFPMYINGVRCSLSLEFPESY